MAKLKELVSTVARVLGDPEPSVNVLAMELRKAGLIRSTGRGRNAAEMTSADATSLLVSCLAGGYATETARTTAHVLSAPLQGYSNSAGLRELRGQSDILERIHHKDHTFGGTLEALLEYFVNIALPRHDRDPHSDPIEGSVIHVVRYHLGYTASIKLRFKNNTEIVLSYEIRNNDVSFHEINKNRSDADGFLDENTVAGYKYGFKMVDIGIGGRVLFDIANCLRGGESASEIKPSAESERGSSKPASRQRLPAT